MKVRPHSPHVHLGSGLTTISPAGRCSFLIVLVVAAAANLRTAHRDCSTRSPIIDLRQSQRSNKWGSGGPGGHPLAGCAARARGLGSVWTCLHLFFEEEAAEVLGIPYAEVMQAAIIPLGYTRGEGFHAAPRDPLHQMVHWEGW